MIDEKKVTLRTFRQIPGVGKTIAADFWNIGLRSLDDLRDRDPEELYDQLNQFQGQIIDRCMLYVFRCAVYYASTPPERHDPEKLKWWSWKDR